MESGVSPASPRVLQPWLRAWAPTGVAKGLSWTLSTSRKGDRIYHQLKKLGSSLDWDRACFTMDPVCRQNPGAGRGCSLGGVPSARKSEHSQGLSHQCLAQT